MIELLHQSLIPKDTGDIFEANFDIGQTQSEIVLYVQRHLLYSWNHGTWLDYGTTNNKTFTFPMGSVNLRIKLKDPSEPVPAGNLKITGRLTRIVEWGAIGTYQVTIESPMPFTVPPFLPSTIKKVSFTQCPLFNDPNVTQWDVSEFDGYNKMFYACFAFNQDLSQWRLNPNLKATHFNSMFQAARKFNQDLSTWDVEQITYKPSAFDADTPAWQEDFKPRWGQPPNVG